MSTPRHGSSNISKRWRTIDCSSQNCNLVGSSVCRSAMREVKRQTQTLIIALEARDANNNIRCDQFLQDRRRWFDSGNSVVFGRSSWWSLESPSTTSQRWQEQHQMECSHTIMLVGILGTTHAQASFSRHETVWWRLQFFEGCTSQAKEGRH